MSDARLEGTILADMHNFKDLEAYKVSKQLAVSTYKASQVWPKEELYGMTSQMRRASISIISNLSEGLGRSTSKDTFHFLAIARGSCNELDAQIEVAHELGYVSLEDKKSLLSQIELSRKLISGLMNRYQNL